LKKISLFLATMAISVSAMAQGYASLEYYDEHNRASSADNIKEAVVVGNKVGTTDYSIKMENSQTSFGNGSISQGLEVRVKETIGAFYIGGRLGEKVTNTTNFSHYAIDAGVKFPLVAGFTGDIGGRYRNAFESGHDFKTTRVHAAVGYPLTKQDSVAVRFSRSYGDEEKDAWRLQYTRSF
jgi:subtilase family serine protease